MSLMTIAPASNGNADASYESGFLDGELDVIRQLPAHLHTARASWGDLYDPMWAAGYTDGFIHATTLNALNQNQQKAN